ncbi:MAG: methyltransferase domain-containing protein [Actinomycetota bacterium]
MTGDPTTTELHLEVPGVARPTDTWRTMTPEAFLDFDLTTFNDGRNPYHEADASVYVANELGLAHFRSTIQQRVQVAGERALDLLSGVGRWTPFLAETHREVYGLDRVVEANRVALGYCRHLGFENVSIFDGEVELIGEFPAESFDTIWLSGALMYLDRSFILSEAHRLLRPGGRLFVGEYNGPGMMMEHILNGIDDGTMEVVGGAAQWGMSAILKGVSDHATPNFATLEYLPELVAEFGLDLVAAAPMGHLDVRQAAGFDGAVESPKVGAYERLVEFLAQKPAGSATPAQVAVEQSGERVRDTPLPYDAVVAVNSDVEFTSLAQQRSLIRAFEEYGLDTSFSFWVLPCGLADWSLLDDHLAPTAESDEILDWIRAGRIDTHHAFSSRIPELHGRADLASMELTRETVDAIYTRLDDLGVRLPIFSNHGGEHDLQNIGFLGATYQAGDVKGSPSYHLDLTLAEGTRYFWTDRDYTIDRAKLRAGFDTDDSLFVLGQCRDGHRIVRFRRFLGSQGGGCDYQNFDQQVAQLLDEDQHRGWSVIFTHLGTVTNADGHFVGAPDPMAPEEADGAFRQALGRLADAQRSGRIAVTTTSDLLDKALFRAIAPYRIRREQRRVTIEVDDSFTIGSVKVAVTENMLDGLAIVAGDADSATLHASGDRRDLVARTHEGERFFELPWDRSTSG